MSTYGFEVEPIFRGASYEDSDLMVSLADGSPVPFVATDGLTWRVFPTAPSRGYVPGYGYGGGWDYGVAADAGFALDRVACQTLTLGQGVAIGSDGAAYWSLSPGQTLALRAGPHRMTFDLDRAGLTVRLVDATVRVMD